MRQAARRAAVSTVEEDFEDEASFESALAAFEQRYWAPLDGAIPICTQGCAIRVWLIVSGAEAGNIWQDDRADELGLKPIPSTHGARTTLQNGTPSGWTRRSRPQASLCILEYCIV